MNQSAPREPTAVLAEVRGILDVHRAAEDTIRMLRGLLDPPLKQRPVKLTDRGWPVLRSAAWVGDDVPERLR
ncbi:hypothetical protein EV652_101841 [Kribbella steppae]|uniref:Uncharacterized protein n=1 Tax=Kribbella steppae TaxID=2512223 RepID=A0A4R2HWM3_9ACTN|nr:hypothetical protein [Kribbella steppae]TCO35953.1 hypothetical protein EV652_101841 [Kribbella steppae]